MCLASKYINNLEEALKGIQDGVKELSEKLSYYDKEKNRIYHKIEVSNYNAAEGFYAYKELQRVLQERRIIKDELAKLKVVNQHLNTKATKGQTKQEVH